MKRENITRRLKSKLTKLNVKEAIKGSGGVISSIAKKLGVDWHTVRDFIDKNTDLKQLLINEEQTIGDMAELSLYTKVQEGNLEATKYILSTKFKHRGYTTHITTDQTVTSTVSIKETDIQKFTDEQLMTLASAKVV